jgi:hypothetical protein
MPGYRVNHALAVGLREPRLSQLAQMKLLSW